MPLAFKPAILKLDQLYELPRPITQIRILDGWDFEQLKVPLAAGDSLVGHSTQGVEILIEGQFGSQAGTLSLTEEEMFDAWLDLRAALSVTSNAEKFELYLYADEDGPTRSFRACSTVRLECDLSRQHLFDYALTIHAEDPTVYLTPPES